MLWRHCARTFLFDMEALTKFKASLKAAAKCLVYCVAPPRKISRQIKGKNNVVAVGDNLRCGELRLIICGDNNRVEVGRNCAFAGVNTIFMSGDNNSIRIGDGVTTDGDVHFIMAEGTSISIGDDCMFAKHTNVRTSDQHSIFDSMGTRTNQPRDVRIGSHVWVGASCLIMKGAQIGDGAVVGIQSMVCKNVPPRSVVAGRPARLIREDIRWTR